MDTSHCCRLIPHLPVQTKNVATLITALYHTHYKQTLQLLLAVECICCIHCCGHLYMLHLLLLTIYAASIAVEYICYIHCGGIYMLHPLLWTFIYTTSTAVDYICCIHCCGIYMQHSLLWNMFSASTAVEYRCYIHCGGIVDMLHPLLWIYGLHPLPWIIRQLTTTSVVSSNVHGRGPVLDFHCCGSGQPAVPVTDSTVI